MNTLEIIDKELTDQAYRISQIAEELKFVEQFQFDIGDEISSLDLSELNFPGVYYFEIQNSQCSNDIGSFLSDFKLKWEAPIYKGEFVPNTKLKRLNKHTSTLEWVPLYIGKAKNISTRLKGHFFMPLYRRTFAMKLSSRENLSGYRIRLSLIKIDVKNYDLIVPKIESHFR